MLSAVARGAPLGVVNDESPLGGPGIDVGARLGWLVRMARQLAPGGPPPLEAMAERAGASSARLHRLETGQLRDGRLIDAYERILDLRPGSLRAPVDALCRTFPAASPPDRDPGPIASSVAAMSELTEAVTQDLVDGAAWMRWARALSQPGAIGMPAGLAADLVRRLAGELSRSVGTGYPARYEALALLRNGEYGAIVLDVVQELVADPHVQVLFDVMSAVGEAITPDAVDWCVGLLDDPRPHVVSGAALALENMAQIAVHPAFWRPLVDPLIERFNGSGLGSDRWETLSHLLRLIPGSELRRAVTGPQQALAPAARIDDWSRTRLNSHWTDVERRAHLVTESAGAPDQPMLARLLFDIAISPHESRAVTSYMLLGGIPLLARPVGEQLADLAEHHDDPVIRARVGRRLAGAMHGTFPAVATSWLDGSDPEQRDRALLLAGAAAQQVPGEALTAALAEGGRSRRCALYAAGMSGHPLIRTLLDHPDEHVSGGARWWAAQGTRVVD